MDMPPCHYIEHPEGPVHALSPGYHSVCPEDLHREPWPDTCYLRGRHPMGNLPHADTFEYRWEAPTSFRRYLSVTPPKHGIRASSPMEAYLPASMELRSHHVTYGWGPTPNGPSAAVERIRSLISVYGQQAHTRRRTYQSPEIGRHPHTRVSVDGSEAHPTRVFPSDATELPPTPGISACGREVSPSFRMH
uniref:Uncharacterized protein n=1 Tax=Arundo donax TaxID=35708 RepID=A0A0A9HF01_ARUDO